MMAFDVEEGEITGESEPESEICNVSGTHKKGYNKANATFPHTPFSSKQRSEMSLDHQHSNIIMETFTTTDIDPSPKILPLTTILSPNKNDQPFNNNNEEADVLPDNLDKKYRKRSRWSDTMTSPNKETSVHQINYRVTRSRTKCDREPVTYEDQSSNDTYKRKLDEHSPSPPHHSTPPPSKSAQHYPNKRGGKFHGGGPPKYFDLDQVPDGEEIEWPIGGKKADDTNRSSPSVGKKQKFTKDYARDKYEHRKKGNNVFEEDFDKQLRLAQKQAFGLPEEEEDIREEDDLDDDGRSSKTNSRDAENPFPCAHPYTQRDQQQNTKFKDGGPKPSGRREGGRSGQSNFRSKPFNNNRGRDRFHRGGQAPRAQSQSSTKYRGSNHRSDNRRGGRGGDHRRPHRDTDAGGNYGGSRSEDRRNNSNNNFGNKNGGGQDKVVSHTPKMVCKFYAEGRCSKGQECNFSHDTKLNYKQEVCKYYVQNTCTKGDNCVFMHSEFPCKYFHSGSQCYAGDSCKFSHDVLSSEKSELLQKVLNQPDNNQYPNYSNADPVKLDHSSNSGPHDTSDLFGEEDFEGETADTQNREAHNNSKESFKHNFYSDSTAAGTGGCDLNSSRGDESSLFGEGSETEREQFKSPPSKHTTPLKLNDVNSRELDGSNDNIKPTKTSTETFVEEKDSVKTVEKGEEIEDNQGNVVNSGDGPSEDNDEQSGDESDDDDAYKPVPLANFLSQLRGPTPTSNNVNSVSSSSPIKALNKAPLLHTSSPVKTKSIEAGSKLNNSYMSVEDEEYDQDESSAKLKIVLEPVENEINNIPTPPKPKMEISREKGEESKGDNSGSEEDEEDDRATYMGLGSVLGMLAAPTASDNSGQQGKTETTKEESYDKDYAKSEGGHWQHKDSNYRDRRGDEDWGEGGNYDSRNHDRRRGGGGARGNNKYAYNNNNQGQSDNYYHHSNSNQAPRRGRGGPRGRGARGFNRRNNEGDNGRGGGRWQGNNRRFQQQNYHSESDANNSYRDDYAKGNSGGEDVAYNSQYNNRGRIAGGRGGHGYDHHEHHARGGGGATMAPPPYSMGIVNNNQGPPQHAPAMFHSGMNANPAMLPLATFNTPHPYNPNFIMNTFGGINPYQQQPYAPSLPPEPPSGPPLDSSPREHHEPTKPKPQPLMMRKGDPRSYAPHKDIKCNPTPPPTLPITKAWILRAITGLCQKRRYQRPPNEVLEQDGKLIDPRTRHPNYKDALNKNPSNPDRASRNIHLDHTRDPLPAVPPKSQGAEGSDPRIRRDPRLSRNSLTPLQSNNEHPLNPLETEYLPYPDAHSNRSPLSHTSSHHNLMNHHRKGSDKGNIHTIDTPKLEASLTTTTTTTKEIVIQPFSQLLGVSSIKEEPSEHVSCSAAAPSGVDLLQNLPLAAKTLPSISGFKIPKKHKPPPPCSVKVEANVALGDNNDSDAGNSNSKTKLNISQYRARLGSLSTLLTAVPRENQAAKVDENAQHFTPEKSPKNFVDQSLKESVFGILDKDHHDNETRLGSEKEGEQVEEDDDVIFEKSVDSHKDLAVIGGSNIFGTGGSLLNSFKAENVFKNGDNIFNMYQEETEEGLGADEGADTAEVGHDVL